MSPKLYYMRKMGRMSMMNNLLTVRIQEHMAHFSKGQRLIAKYIERAL